MSKIKFAIYNVVGDMWVKNRGAEKNKLPQILLILILKYVTSNNVMLKLQKS